MNHEPGRTLTGLLASIADLHVDESANSALVISETAQAAVQLHREGLLADEMPDDDELLNQYVTSTLQRAVKNNQAKMKKRLAAGGVQKGFDLGDEFESTITVCGHRALSQMTGISTTSGRIVTLGSLTGADLRLMALEQDIVLQDLLEAHHRDQPYFAAFADILSKHGTYRSYAAWLAKTA